jgi:AraC-like DNA-binding protein
MFKVALLLSPVYVTLFWAIVLSIQSRKIHSPKHFLGWFMMVAFVLYLSHFFYFVQNFEVYYYMDSIYTLAYLLVFPLYHIYVRLLTVDDAINSKKHGKFLIAPIVIFLLTLIGYLIMGKHDGMYYITSVLPGDVSPTGIHLYMKSVFVLGRVVFLLQATLYLFLNFRLIRANNIKMQDYFSNMEERKLNWLQFFNFSMAFTSLAGIVLAILGREMFQDHEFFLIFPSAVFSAMLFFIGFLGNSQKAIFTELEKEQLPYIEGKPSVSLKGKLDNLFQEEKIFKNPDLKIWDVSLMLGTNRTYVSKMINSGYDRNFCAFVNHYRVEHAKSVMRNNKNLTNEQIGELSGFGSVNSFYRAFLDHENMSLSQYRKLIEK